jgi:hypothetical protein
MGTVSLHGMGMVGYDEKKRNKQLKKIKKIEVKWLRRMDIG